MKTTWHIFFLGILSLGHAEPLTPEQLAPQITPEQLAPKFTPAHLAPEVQVQSQQQPAPQVPPQQQQPPPQLPPQQQQQSPQLPPQQQQPPPQLPPQQQQPSPDNRALYLDHSHSKRLEHTHERAPVQRPSQYTPQQYSPPPQNPPPQQYSPPPQNPPPQQYSPPPQYPPPQQYSPPQKQNTQSNGFGNEREVNTPGGSEGFDKYHNDQSAQLGDFPYKVQIRHGQDFIGGGTLIRSPLTGKQIVLTCAHILTEKGPNGTVQAVKANEISLRMGIIFKDDYGQYRQVVRNFIHPGYIHWRQEDRPIFNDVAILVPDVPFDLNDHVQTLALPAGDWPAVHETVVVKGWGQGREAGHTGVSKWLRYFEVPVWDSYKCDAVYYKESGLDLITKKHFCAGFEDGRKDSCGGDSGGAAMSKRNGVPYLAGVVSWGKGCGTPGYPGVYSKVYGHLDWIKQTMYLYEKFGYI